MITNDTTELIDTHRYELEYVYDKDVWTVPVVLTTERREKMLNDNSISRVRFTPILRYDGLLSFTFNHADLV